MANTIPTSARQLFLNGDVDLINDTIKIIAVKSGYTYSSAHNYLDDVSATYRASTVTLTSKTTTSGAFDSADPVFSAVVAGSTITGLWIYQDTAVEATSALLAWYDTQASTAPISITTSGGNITITVSATGWFSI
jgi:hypothetical protein